jgi:hypothetical protein
MKPHSEINLFLVNVEFVIWPSPCHLPSLPPQHLHEYKPVALTHQTGIISPLITLSSPLPARYIINSIIEGQHAPHPASLPGIVTRLSTENTGYDFRWTLAQIEAGEIPGVTTQEGQVHIDRNQLDEESLTIVRTALSLTYLLDETNNKTETWQPIE